ncbi:MAG: hypothetical protein H7Z11_04135 [Verrucomicrobia bacterium]|nr:hypothetical protein [Leptolyngbya sp. ES-bin-22]
MHITEISLCVYKQLFCRWHGCASEAIAHCLSLTKASLQADERSPSSQLSAASAD